MLFFDDFGVYFVPIIDEEGPNDRTYIRAYDDHDKECDIDDDFDDRILDDM